LVGLIDIFVAFLEPLISELFPGVFKLVFRRRKIQVFLFFLKFLNSVIQNLYPVINPS
jgi:hypothetical protein